MTKEWMCGAARTWKCLLEYGCVVEVSKPFLVVVLATYLDHFILTHFLVCVKPIQPSVQFFINFLKYIFCYRQQRYTRH